MVDLVKIRKKAKEKQEGNGAGLQGNAPAGTQEKVVEAAPEPKTKTAKPKQQPAAPEQKTAAKTPEPPAVPEPQPAPAPPPTAPQPPAAARPEVPQPAASSKLEKFKQRAGRLRADADQAGVNAETTQQAIDESALELLTFAIAGEHYAIDIEHIVEIVPPRTPTRVPNADTSIVGILSLRGTIVTLVDVRRRLRHERSAVTPDTRIVVVDHHGETIGFEVDRVFRVVKITESEVSPHPVVHASELDESIRGVFRQADALTILLDFDKLLDRREKPRNNAVESAASPV